MGGGGCRSIQGVLEVRPRQAGRTSRQNNGARGPGRRHANMTEGQEWDTITKRPAHEQRKGERLGGFRSGVRWVVSAFLPDRIPAMATRRQPGVRPDVQRSGGHPRPLVADDQDDKNAEEEEESNEQTTVVLQAAPGAEQTDRFPEVPRHAETPRAEVGSAANIEPTMQSRADPFPEVQKGANPLRI